jgi:hypothetical protein
MKRIYAGIGSRETPGDVLRTMKAFAARMFSFGYTLRTGGASGADSAFIEGVSTPASGPNRCEIYLPWKGYRQGEFSEEGAVLYCEPSKAAHKLASSFHPVWKSLPVGVKKLHARNAHIIFGPDVDSEVDFVVCWTRDGARNAKETNSGTGGTGQAIRMADAHQIPVINMACEEHVRIVRALLSDSKEAISRFELWIAGKAVLPF